MKTTLKALIVCLLIIASSFGTFAPAQVRRQQQSQTEAARVRGTRVQLVPPAGFKPSPQFPGFWLPQANAAVMVTEMRGPFSEISAGFKDKNSSALAARGMTIQSVQEVSPGNQPGLLVRFSQRVSGDVHMKWVFITGDENETLMVTATAPRSHDARLSEQLKQSVLSARWMRDAAPEVAADELGFSIDAAGDLQRVNAMTNALMFTTRGIFPVQTSDEALFIATPSISLVAVTDLRAYAEARVRNLNKNVTGVRILNTTPVKIDGLNGFEIVATGTDTFKDNPYPVTIHQTMLFDDSSYFIMVGMVKTELAPQHIETFKSMAQSFKRTNAKP